MNLFSILSLFACAIYLSVGVHTFILDRKSEINKLFLFLCISMAVWSFAYSFVYIADTDHGIWIKISALGWCTFSAIILHLTLVFTENPVFNRPVQYALLYLPALVFLYMSVFLFRTDVKPPVIVSIFFYAGDFIYNFSYLLVSIVIIYKWGRKSHNTRRHKQADINADLLCK